MMVRILKYISLLIEFRILFPFELVKMIESHFHKYDVFTITFLYNMYVVIILIDLRMFAANEKVFKLFFLPLFFDSKIQHKTFENKINIG